MENQDVNVETLGNVINAMAQSVENESKRKYNETILSLMEKHGEKIKNPETFSRLISHDHEKMERTLVNHLLEEMDFSLEVRKDRETMSKIRFIYLNYDFIESHLRGIVGENEGRACCADKSRYLIKEYLDYLKNKDLPVWSSREDFWVPYYGSPSLWLKLIEDAIYLKMGHLDKYLETYQSLIESIKEDVEARTKSVAEQLSKNPYYVDSEETDEGTVYKFERRIEKENFVFHIRFGKDSGIGTLLFKIHESGEKERLYHSPEWVRDITRSL